MKQKPSFFKYKFNDWSRDFTSLANPIILIVIPFIFLFEKNEKGFYILLIALAINEIFGSLIKIIFPKTRPNGQQYNNLLEKIDAGSFPSLHSSRITIVYLTLFTFANLLLFKGIFISIIPIVMLSRINLKKHFITDIIGGFVIGLIIWWISINYF
ncbi:MAG: membrane-associated phospholipid phosphatase [Planctomycetota bacterium]|jgi:membrane-associated phospholipid phosphatase